jgi:hypothetical protein
MLPPIEKSPILALQWSEKVKRDSELKETLIPLVKQQLEESKMLILPSPSQEILLLTTTQKVLEDEAKDAHVQRFQRNRNDHGSVYCR